MTTTSTRGLVLRLAGLVAVVLLAACSSQAEGDPAAHAATSASTATAPAPAVAAAERPADAVAATAAVAVVWQGSGDLCETGRR